MFAESSYYELRGGPQVGKTTVALLLASSKLFANVVYVTTGEEHTPDLMCWLRPDVEAVTVGSVAVFFEVVREMSGNVSLIVLDSLSTLRPDHPAARQLAPSVERHWCRPSCPVLVVNQDRYPYPVGGWFWRSQLRGGFELVRYRERPFLMSELRPTGLWLTWGSGQPELRMLGDEEREVWIGQCVGERPGSVPGR